MLEETGSPPAARQGEGGLRWVIVGLLLGAVLVLAFGLGFGVHQLVEDDEVRTVVQTTTGSGAEQPVVSSDAGDAEAPSDEFGIINEIISILGTDFFDPSRVDPEILREAAIDGILGALNDPHSIYIPAEDNAIGAADIYSSYEGIGATVAEEQGFVIITQPFPGSPAEEAGLKPGDIILEVDGESAEGWSTTQAVIRIRGPRGTDVELKIRHADGTEEVVIITRSEIELKSVFYPCEGTSSDGCLQTTAYGQPLNDAQGNQVTDIGYMWINQYHDRTDEELLTALDWMRGQGYDKLILDIRLNPGGLLQETVVTTDEFVDEGIIIGQVDREGNEVFQEARPGGEGLDFEVVVLTDENSASGSEVMAAAIRDNGEGIIIGERTFGKGTVNHLRELSDGSAIYVSIARWLTPTGAQIEGLGVRPDIEVDGQLQQILAGEIEGDPIFQRAVEYLRTGQ